RGRAFSGGPAAEGDGWVPNLTPDRTGLADWSAKEIASSLKDGFLPDFDSFGGAMVAVQENTAKLTDADRAAIAAFLKSLRPIANAPPKKPDTGNGG
ncbi:MAG: cytochrome C, partial [Hyphomicrobiales bacterium]|nr:cytochrome C [Hyphomicrobiales bacterium]